MLTALNEILLKIADPLLGWLLYLPTDVALILVAVATAATLNFARLWTTNQDLLRRCAQDKKRLKQLIKEAKQENDWDAVRRYRASIGTIALKTLKSEGRPLLVAIVPVAILALWCFYRLEFHPPRGGETVPVHVYLPISAAGGLIHVVPQDGVTAEDGWVKQIVAVPEPESGPPYAMATWHLRAEARAEPYTLEIRYKRAWITKRLLVGQRTYAVPVEFYAPEGPVTCTEIQMKPVKLFGVVPGFPPLALAPWLVAYFLIAIPSVSLIKRLTGIR
jgi:uncharacterized membrane protein (DUF106 family)